MPTYTVVGTRYCSKRKGFLRLRRGPTRKSPTRTLTITSPSKEAAIRAYRQVVPVDPGCELRIFASQTTLAGPKKRRRRLS
jgi:hypothetical protein